ncbi:MAG: 2,3,4,5-tetrahydropyridine-2,6-dicarboxylate N-succinyltransferase [Candidatus Kryptoniota bacterium]
MNKLELQEKIEVEYRSGSITSKTERLVRSFLELLDSGQIRAAEIDHTTESGWRVCTWVKEGILLAFRTGKVTEIRLGSNNIFFDKHNLPPKSLKIGSGIRLVPGGSSIRKGAFVASGVVIMPPTYVNIGAYVDSGTMLDSHTLVGSCAQIGRHVHLSAGAQIGGVLEPVGQLPVIIEDEVMIGGNSGIYEGTVVKRRAVIAAGCIITGSTPVYDLVRKKVYRKDENKPLIIPEGAVVVPGSRRTSNSFGNVNGISLYTPVIVKYRDERTDAATVLESALR